MQIITLFLLLMPFYFTYVFRKRKIYPELGALKSIILVCFMLYISTIGIQKLFILNAWEKDGKVPALVFFLALLHLWIAIGLPKDTKWDPGSGDSF